MAVFCDWPVTELVFSVASTFEDVSVFRYFFFGTVFHHRGTLLFIFPFIGGRTLELDSGAIVNIAALQMCVQVFGQVFSVFVSRSRAAGARADSMFNIFGDLPRVFQSGCTILRPQPWWTRF